MNARCTLISELLVISKSQFEEHLNKAPKRSLRCINNHIISPQAESNRDDQSERYYCNYLSPSIYPSIHPSLPPDDIQVRFVEQGPDGSTKWEAFGNFGPLDVHRQVGILRVHFIWNKSSLPVNWLKYGLFECYC